VLSASVLSVFFPKLLASPHKTELLGITGPVFFAGWTPFLLPNQQCKYTAGNVLEITLLAKISHDGKRDQTQYYAVCSANIKARLK